MIGPGGCQDLRLVLGAISSIQHLLDRRAVVAADAVAVLAADHYEAAAEVLDPSAIEVHLLAGKVQRGDIAEEEKVELLEKIEQEREYLSRMGTDILEYYDEGEKDGD